MSASGFDEARLRHPLEKTIFIVSVAFNLALIAVAVLLILISPDWLGKRSAVAAALKAARPWLLAAIFAAPLIFMLRNVRAANVAQNGIRLSGSQFPCFHEPLVRHCRKLGMPVPGLYLSMAYSGWTLAFSTFGNHYVVLGANFLVDRLDQCPEAVAFLIGRELGRLRLGHTRWWNEMLLTYIILIPLLQNPLLQVRAYSYDRYGAYLAPNGVAGLIVLASAPDYVGDVNVGEYLDQAQRRGGFWALAARITRTEPHISDRVRALYGVGLFERERDCQLREGGDANLDY